jgi:hypothetical protein
LRQIQAAENTSHENLTTRSLGAKLWSLIPDQNPRSLPGTPNRQIEATLFSQQDIRLFGPYQTAETAAKKLLESLGIERADNPSSIAPLTPVAPNLIAGLISGVSRLQGVLDDKPPSVPRSSPDSPQSTANSFQHEQGRNRADEWRAQIRRGVVRRDSSKLLSIRDSMRGLSGQRDERKITEEEYRGFAMDLLCKAISFGAFEGPRWQIYLTKLATAPSFENSVKLLDTDAPLRIKGFKQNDTPLVDDGTWEISCLIDPANNPAESTPPSSPVASPVAPEPQSAAMGSGAAEPPKVEPAKTAEKSKTLSTTDIAALLGVTSEHAARIASKLDGRDKSSGSWKVPESSVNTYVVRQKKRQKRRDNESPAVQRWVCGNAHTTESIIKPKKCSHAGCRNTDFMSEG